MRNFLANRPIGPFAKDQSISTKTAAEKLGVSQRAAVAVELANMRHGGWRGNQYEKLSGKPPIGGLPESLIIALTIHRGVAVAARDAFMASLRAPSASARVSARQSV
jgi:hypothetical protein